MVDYSKPALLSADDLAREIGVGRTKANAMLHSGKFDVRRIGKLVRITRASFDAYIASLPTGKAA